LNKDVKKLNLKALNVYLVDLRENRKLRSNERMRSAENGLVFDDPAPARLDCHYLISAWSPMKEITPTVEPVPDEHALLYQAAAALMHNAPFNPSRVYPAGSGALNAWPARFQDVDLPAVVAPVEGFPKLAEFWGTMGKDYRWKPVLYLVVTVPVELLRERAGPMVTTRITEYRQTDRPETAEVYIQIAGVVAATTGELLDDVWVGLEANSGELLQKTRTDERGHFTFVGLTAGSYTLRARAPGFRETEAPLDVPSPSGSYDIQLVR
jgi:hypothetical protein